jgi:hypothetical protein
VTDLIAQGEAWFEAQRRAHASVEVEYQPVVGLPRQCMATLIVGRWDTIDNSGAVVRHETKDFFVSVSDLQQDPARGDRIVVGGQTYTVTIPQGSSQTWRWANRSQSLRRIHTMPTAGATATANATLLVRAVGASTAAAITDQQIVAQLALDLGTTRAIERNVVAAAAYLYVVLPVSFGDPLIDVNGLRVTAWEVTERSITFAGQTARPYRVLRSTYPVSGTVRVEVS